MKLRDLKVVQPDPEPGGYTAWGTEDIISLGGNTTWGGTAMTDDDALIVERFKFDGGDWQSPSGTGSFIGDGDLTGGHGQYVWFRDGVLLNPGQCAIGTGEQGPYRFERIDVFGDHGGENAAFQVRSARRVDRRRAAPTGRPRQINGDAPATRTSGATTSRPRSPSGDAVSVRDDPVLFLQQGKGKTTGGSARSAAERDHDDARPPAQRPRAHARDRRRPAERDGRRARAAAEALGHHDRHAPRRRDVDGRPAAPGMRSSTSRAGSRSSRPTARWARPRRSTPPTATSTRAR
jgi:hypothetical protein